MEKKELRRIVAERKRQRSEEELLGLSLSAAKSLLANPHVRSAHTVLLYYSMKGETDTHRLVDELYRRGLEVLLPKVVGDGIMTLISYTGNDCLKPSGKFHILEPEGEPFTDYGKIDVAIVPGIAFTRDGKRLGRGGGYYDRLLPLLPHSWKIGLCFPFQVFDDIPTEPLDIMVDEIVC